MNPKKPQTSRLASPARAAAPRLGGDARGLSLVELLVASALLGIVAVALFQGLGVADRMARSNRNDVEIMTLARSIQLGVDCGETFASAGINPLAPAGQCNSLSATAALQVGPYLHLKKKLRDNSVSDLFATWDPVTQAHAVKDWRIRVTCSQAERSLVVRVARVTATGFAKDATRTTFAFDWSSPKALVFGGSSRPGLCTSSFVPTPTPPGQCPMGQMMIGYDRGTNKPTCKPFPTVTCNPQHVLMGIAYDPASKTMKAHCQPQTFAGTYYVANWKPASPPSYNTCIVSNVYTGKCNCPVGFSPVEGSGLEEWCKRNPPFDDPWFGRGCAANVQKGYNAMVPNNARTGATGYACVPN